MNTSYVAQERCLSTYKVKVGKASIARKCGIFCLNLLLEDTANSIWKCSIFYGNAAGRCCIYYMNMLNILEDAAAYARLWSVKTIIHFISVY